MSPPQCNSANIQGVEQGRTESLQSTRIFPTISTQSALATVWWQQSPLDQPCGCKIMDYWTPLWLWGNQHNTSTTWAASGYWGKDQPLQPLRQGPPTTNQAAEPNWPSMPSESVRPFLHENLGKHSCCCCSACHSSPDHCYAINVFVVPPFLSSWCTMKHGLVTRKVHAVAIRRQSNWEEDSDSASNEPRILVYLTAQPNTWWQHGRDNMPTKEKKSPKEAKKSGWRNHRVGEALVKNSVWTIQYLYCTYSTGRVIQ